MCKVLTQNQVNYNIAFLPLKFTNENWLGKEKEEGKEKKLNAFTRLPDSKTTATSN